MKRLMKRDFQREIFRLCEGFELVKVVGRGGKFFGYFVPADAMHSGGIDAMQKDFDAMHIAAKVDTEAVKGDAMQSAKIRNASDLGGESGNNPVDLGADAMHEEEKCMKCKRGVIGRVGQGETADGSFEEIRICEFCWMKAGSPKWYKKI